ncbi:Uncharacterised protein [Streptococcus pneumoniae]|nr:Uncharacterised protein [Streptococcus pneumoniae]
MLKFSRQLRSHSLTCRMDIDTVDIRIRAGKVDILHRTNRQLGIICIAVILNALVINDHNLTWLQITNPLGTNDLKSTGFRGNNHRSVGHFPDRKRTKAIRVKSRNQLVLKQQDIGKTTFDKAERFLDFAHQARIMTATNEVSQDFRVRSRAENCSSLFQFFLERGCIGQISIMSQAKLHIVKTEEEGLDVIYRSFASSRITHMPNRTSSCQFIQISWISENF